MDGIFEASSYKTPSRFEKRQGYSSEIFIFIGGNIDVFNVIIFLPIFVKLGIFAFGIIKKIVGIFAENLRKIGSFILLFFNLMLFKFRAKKRTIFAGNFGRRPRANRVFSPKIIPRSSARIAFMTIAKSCGINLAKLSYSISHDILQFYF